MFQRLLRRAKLIVIAPKEIEGLRDEVLKATRATEQAINIHMKLLDRRGVTAEQESRAYKSVGSAQIKQLLATKVLNLAKESYLRTGSVNTEAIKAQLAEQANKPNATKHRR